MKVAVGAIALLGPGLDGWSASRQVLAGAASYVATPPQLPAPTSLPPAERRRTTPTIRLAMAAAEATLAAAAPLDPSGLASVFASANGDGTVIDAILATLATPQRAVSPTQFHNSVHNSPAAYWAIGHGSNGPSASLGCWDASFAAGLLQAAAKVQARREPVLFCAYDAAFPPPLDAVRPTSLPFATAMILTPNPEAYSEARISIRFAVGGCDEALAAPRLASLQPLRQANAAAHALRLLETVARREADSIQLAYLDDSHLVVEVTPC
jgi:hypothetical protein